MSYQFSYVALYAPLNWYNFDRIPTYSCEFLTEKIIDDQVLVLPLDFPKIGASAILYPYIVALQDLLHAYDYAV